VHVHNETPTPCTTATDGSDGVQAHLPPRALCLRDFLRLSLSNTLSDLWHAREQGVLLSSLGASSGSA